MKISIILPAYNAELTLAECVQSLLRQKINADFEILLINDGSKDKTGEICDNLSKENNKIKVFHLDNAGVSNARNFGIDKSKGDYIFFIDADDYLENNYISDMYEAAIKNNLDIVVSGFCAKFYTGESLKYGVKSTKVYKSPNMASIVNDLISKNLFNVVWNKLYSRKSLSNIKFDTEVIQGEDLIFNLYVFLKERSVGILPNIGYNYIIAKPNSKKPSRIRDNNKMRRRIEIYNDILSTDGISEDFKQIIYRKQLDFFHFQATYASHKPTLAEKKSLYKERICNESNLIIKISKKINRLSFLDRILIASSKPRYMYLGIKAIPFILKTKKVLRSICIKLKLKR